MKNYFIKNETYKLEVTDWEGKDPSLTPILFIPGMLGTAVSFKEEVETNWRDRRCVSLSFRGRGQSDAPDQGYQLANHVSDIVSVLNQLELLSGVILVAHSRGVPYALGFAAAHPRAVKALALLDHPPFHLPIEPEWAEKLCAQLRPGMPPEKVIRALQREADFRDLRGTLAGLTCPVLFVAGGQPGSMLSREDLVEFSQGIKSCVLHVEENSGHELETLPLRKLLNPLIN
ncbi:MAG: alpha/beta hydrolase [Elusimicrobia bacterium]|nr:alpha/beta hydrolase [Elusimicrobiota bacterium]